MNSKARYIPLAVIGAIVLSLLAILPAAGADNVEFTVAGDTDEALEWGRQGGEIGILVENDELDFPIQRVLVRGYDTEIIGYVQTDGSLAHSDMITMALKASATEPTDGDYIVFGDHTVREITDVEKKLDGEQPVVSLSGLGSGQPLYDITVDAALHEALSEDVEIQLVKSGVTDVDGWSGNYSHYALAKTASSFDAQVEIPGLRNSNIGESADDRLEGSPATGNRHLNEGDILVRDFNDGDSDLTEVGIGTDSYAEGVLDLSDDGVDNDGGKIRYVLFWTDDINYTGSTVEIDSNGEPVDDTVVVLTETDIDSGEFAITIKLVKPTETDDNGDRVAGTGTDLSATVPEFAVNTGDTVTAESGDESAELDVETTPPTFTGFAPPHNTRGREDRPEVNAAASDSRSGVSEDNVKVLFQIEENHQPGVEWVLIDDSTAADIESVTGGYEIFAKFRGGQAPDDGTDINWWVIAEDDAGNLGVSDRKPTSEDVSRCDTTTDVLNPTPGEFRTAWDAADAADLGDLLVRPILDDGGEAVDDANCQPYTVVYDEDRPAMKAAETGRHWDTSLDTGDSNDKTEYRQGESSDTSILVVFDEYLDTTTVTATDFEVNDDEPLSVEAYNVKVRDDTSVDDEMNFDGDGNDSLAGKLPAGVGEGENYGYVFLTIPAMDADDRPKVELVGEVEDVAGNSLSSGRVSKATDRIAPSLTVTIDEGDRPVTNDEINITITADEGIGRPVVTVCSVTYSDVDDEESQEVSCDTHQPEFVSSDEYTAAINPESLGLHTVHVSAMDAAGGSNEGTKGDMSAPVDVDSDTSAILFEWDDNIDAPDVDPDKEGTQDAFETDDVNAFIRIDFSAEGNEYYMDDDVSTSTIDLDTHAMVTIVSATLDDEDITSGLQADDSGNVFLYRASDLSVGEHDLEVQAVDEAGNELATPAALTITIVERDPYSLELNPGWNLVSIPGRAEDASLDAVVPVDHPVDQILTYDPSVEGNWLIARRGDDGSWSGTLRELNEKRAYWMHTESFEALDVSIPKLSAGTFEAPPSIPISVGWNLVPVLDPDGDFELEDDHNYFSGLPDDAITGVYTYNTITGQWEPVNVNDNGVRRVEIGMGYWVYANEPGVIVP